MKKLVLMAIVLCGLLTAGNPAMATVALSFDPVDPVVSVGDSITVNLVVSGLESLDLSTYDLNVSYDSGILSFSGYALGSGLGNSTGESFDIGLGDDGFGQINLCEISMLLDLNSQEDSFTLATLTFAVIALGSSSLTISVSELGDALGDSIATCSIGSANVNVVPIPAAAWLFGSGLLGLAGLRKRLA